MPIIPDETEWASFDVFPGYAVNNHGQVYNTLKRKYLKPSLNDSGFLRVGLLVNGVQRFIYVHRMVAMAFLDDYIEGYEVRFIDRDKTNCAADNLYMGVKRSRVRKDWLF